MDKAMESINGPCNNEHLVIEIKVHLRDKAGNVNGVYSTFLKKYFFG